ncbi:MAG: hypothetical protein JW880_08170 [Candidatus Thermoplasmatota archaeon]|nr:hypothetical protein [Candidatus Thermoplasmatota archaeon]
MENDSCTEEPGTDSWDHVSELALRTQETVDRCLSILRLSGGVIKDKTRTANRIDGLLTKMIESPSSARYLPNIDRNLDYLFTSLQLDMIDIVASDVAADERRRAEKVRGEAEPPNRIL